jgi:hypothetical protein
MPGSSYLEDTNVSLSRPFKAQRAHGQDGWRKVSWLAEKPRRRRVDNC